MLSRFPHMIHCQKLNYFTDGEKIDNFFGLVDLQSSGMK